MGEKISTVVVIPTYNEASQIKELILAVLHLHPDFDILVVDDNSTDGTARIVAELAPDSGKIKILHHAKKSGLGKAYVDGFRFVLGQAVIYKRIVEMDADFSHHPEYLGDLLAAAENADLVIGSRYATGGRITDWKLGRRVFSYMANLYTRLWLGLEVRDCTSGFRCFRREVLDSVGLENIRSNGYLFQIEVLARCRSLGYSIKEVPITFTERKKGRTKLGFYEIWEAFWGVPGLYFRDGLRAGK